MPPRSIPTARQRRLGAELRKLRERAGMTASEAGTLMGIDQARMSNIEAGRVGVSPARVRTLACNYACAETDFVDALASLAADRSRQWWEEYKGVLPAALLDLAELEHHADGMRTAQTSSLPGLLQTVDHARSVFQQAVPQLPPHEIEHRTSWRIKRQAVLYREEPLPYAAIVHEAALRMQFGGRDVARSQLRHLLTMSERPGLSLLVVPFTAGAFPGAGQTICYADGPVPQLDTVQLDQSHGPVLLDAEAQLNKYRMLIDRLRELSLDPAQSRDLVHRIAKTL